MFCLRRPSRHLIGQWRLDILSRLFCACRMMVFLGVLPAVGVAKVLELFVPVFATDRAETPDLGVAFPDSGGRLITGGIGIEPAPDRIHLQGLDPLGRRGVVPAGSRLASQGTNTALTRLLWSPSSSDVQGRRGNGIPCRGSSD